MNKVLAVLIFSSMYSGDLDSLLVRYSDHGDLFDNQIVCYSYIWCHGSLVFRSPFGYRLVFRPPFKYQSVIQMPDAMVLGI